MLIARRDEAGNSVSFFRLMEASGCLGQENKHAIRRI